MSPIQLVVLILMFAAPAYFAVAAVSTAPGRRRRPRLGDRLEVLTQLVNSIGFLAVGRAVLPWEQLPVALWGAAVSLTALALLASARTFRELPVICPSARPALRVANCALNVAAGVVLTALFVS